MLTPYLCLILKAALGRHYSLVRRLIYFTIFLTYDIYSSHLPRYSIPAI